MLHAVTVTVPTGKTADLTDSVGLILDDTYVNHDIINGSPSISISSLVFAKDLRDEQRAGNLEISVNGYLLTSIHILDLILGVEQIIDHEFEFVATADSTWHDYILPAGFDNKKIDIVIMNDDVVNSINAGIRHPDSNKEKRAKIGIDASLNFNVNTGGDCKIQIYTTDKTNTRYRVTSERGS